MLIEIALLAFQPVAPLPDPWEAVTDPCEIAAELGYDAWVPTCELAVPLTSGLGAQIEAVGFNLRLEEGTTVGNGATLGYFAEFDQTYQQYSRASVLLSLVCTNTATDEYTTNSAPVELRLMRDWNNEAEGYVTLNANGPCGIGERRDILTLAVVSTADTPWWGAGLPDTSTGWDNGNNMAWWSTSRYRFEVLSETGAYGTTGSATVRMTVLARPSTWPNNNDGPRCFVSDPNGVTTACTYSGGTSGLYYQNWPGYTVSDPPPLGFSKTFTVTFTSSQIGFSAGRLVQGGAVNDVVWRRTGAPSRFEPDVDVWRSLGTVTAYEPVSDIDWTPIVEDPTIGDLDGLCEDGAIINCVNLCLDELTPGWNPLDNVGDFVGFLRCLLVPNVDVGELATAASDDLQATLLFQVFQLGLESVVESAQAPAVFAKECGLVLDLHYQVFGGFDVQASTCDFPPTARQAMYWTLLVIVSLGMLMSMIYVMTWALNWNSPVGGKGDE